MTTIESIFQRTDTPESADFAILDLAQKDEGQLLGWLYNHFDLGDIPWNPLYQGTELASNWSTGPILIELRDAQVFREALIERYQSDCLGMLISAPDVSLAAMADHLRSLIIPLLDGKPSVFRFYDPRSLGPLLTVLQPKQRYQLLGVSQWCWCNDGQWWVTTESQPAAWPQPGSTLALGKAQLEALDEARIAQFAESLTNYYRPHISASDPEQFVLGEIKSANNAGISLLADQERWVRLAIQAGVPLTESTSWQHLASDQGLSPSQILAHLESEQRTVAHVN